MGRSKKKDEGKGYENRFINIPVFIFKKGDKIIDQDGYVGTVLSDMEYPLTFGHVLKSKIYVGFDLSDPSSYMYIKYINLQLFSDEENRKN